MSYSIAISWHFAHHAGHNGYKQILTHTKPLAIIGIDEREPVTVDRWHRRYPWLYEFRAAGIHRKTPCQVLHVLYGETYFRFSPWLFGSTPVVVTFHQPPELLKRNLAEGSGTGRVSKLIHRLTRARFKRLGAAIIISEEQRAVLADYMPSERIHHIPLGASTEILIEAELLHRRVADRQHVLTVGNWLRDWEFYFDFLDYCRLHHPTWRFSLVNRNLPASWHTRAMGCVNLEWHRNATDEQLFSLFADAGCLLLPLLEATGNNTVNEALAFGCPLVSNVLFGIPNSAALVTICEKTFESFAAGITLWENASEAQRMDYRKISQKSVRELDWKATAAKTLEVYQSLL